MAGFPTRHPLVERFLAFETASLALSLAKPYMFMERSKATQQSRRSQRRLTTKMDRHATPSRDSRWRSPGFRRRVKWWYRRSPRPEASANYPAKHRHCEERSDVAIQPSPFYSRNFLRFPGITIMICAVPGFDCDTDLGFDFDYPSHRNSPPVRIRKFRF